MESTKTESSKKNKSKGQNRILQCFKPTTLDDSFEETSPRNRANPVLTYFAVAEEASGVILPTILSSALSSEDCTVNVSRRKKNADHHSFWQALKKALAKKITKKKAATQKFCITRGESGKVSTFDVNDKTQETNSLASSGLRCSSVFTPSSLSSKISTPLSRTLGSSSRSSEFSRTISSNSLLSSANTEVANFKRQEADSVKESGQGQGRYDTNKGLFLLMISLLVLILCGKFCAILCTSIWLFVAPRRSLKCNRPAGFREMSKLNSFQYKKKIIMEGLLERKHSRLNTPYVAKS